MLRMKKKKAEEAKANAAQAASPSDQNKTSNSVSLIGIGGQRIKQNGATKTETRPASIIRLQKGKKNLIHNVLLRVHTHILHLMNSKNTTSIFDFFKSIFRYQRVG